jgi:hypothetical protein
MKPTPHLLTAAECDALMEAFRAKSLAQGECNPVFHAWQEAAQLLHDARRASFAKRSKARLAKWRPISR